jgi:hypothetical protein
MLLMATIGDTVKLGGEFRTWNGIYADPTAITLTIYDKARRVIETVSITNANKVSLGIYEYEYVVPAGVGDLEYEYSGTLEGKPITGRAVLVREWRTNN